MVVVVAGVAVVLHPCSLSVRLIALSTLPRVGVLRHSAIAGAPLLSSSVGFPVLFSLLGCSLRGAGSLFLSFPWISLLLLHSVCVGCSSLVWFLRLLISGLSKFTGFLWVD